MRYITAFFMAWGNFLVIPCPCKLWDSRLNRLMLAFLPEIGALIGGTLALLLLAAHALMLPALLTGLLLTYALFRIPGYMHLDGFMDVSDAVMSRRGKEERQRILKDSRVGAFAVINVVFLILAVFAGFVIREGAGSLLTGVFLIPVVSRSMAGMFVSGLRPMEQSQYAATAGEPGRRKYVVAILLQMAAWTVGSLLLAGPAGPAVFTALIPPAVEIGAASLACAHGVRRLGGMNGDIAGYVICVSEAAAVLTLGILQL